MPTDDQIKWKRHQIKGEVSLAVKKHFLLKKLLGDRSGSQSKSLRPLSCLHVAILHWKQSSLEMGVPSRLPPGTMPVPFVLASLLCDPQHLSQSIPGSPTCSRHPGHNHFWRPPHSLWGPGTWTAACPAGFDDSGGIHCLFAFLWLVSMLSGFQMCNIHF